MHLRCPHCQNPIEIADVPSATEITGPGCGSSFTFDPYATTSKAPPAQRIGKFEVLTLLGEGAFGSVFKARDAERMGVLQGVGDVGDQLGGFVERQASCRQDVPERQAFDEIADQIRSAVVDADFVDRDDRRESQLGDGAGFAQETIDILRA